MTTAPGPMGPRFTAPIGVDVKGGHMLSISAAVRKRIGKNVGDDVEVHITERLN